MALGTEVQARYSSQMLLALTNPQDASAGTLDTGRFNAAVADVEADFQIYAGLEYDDSAANLDAALHINVGCEGVIAKLRLRTDQAGPAEQRDNDRWVQKLQDLARVTARDRITPSVKTREGDPKDPIFDVRRFRELIPNSPVIREEDISRRSLYPE